MVKSEQAKKYKIRILKSKIRNLQNTVDKLWVRLYDLDEEEGAKLHESIISQESRWSESRWS